MAVSDADRWNARYATGGDEWRNRRPRQLLLDHSHLLPSTGLGLDAASGVAVNGLFLAAHGLHVLALDISVVALRIAKQVANERGLWLETAVFDLTNPWLPANKFDVILNFRFLERGIFPVYQQALKPGGLLLFETFVKTSNDIEYPRHYLDPGELGNAFATLEQKHHEIVRSENPRTKEVRVTEQLVARKIRR